MSSGNRTAATITFHWALAALLGLGSALAASPIACAQENPQTAPAGQTPARPPGAQNGPGDSSAQQKATPETHITPEQAKELFALVDQLMKFSSEETGLPIKSDVKRQLTSRAQVESYLREKFNEDEGARRMQRGEIVLKKFGLLDHDFDLKPFLLVLLKEQIAAYYDSKNKTVTFRATRWIPRARRWPRARRRRS
jgi:hypothetical protein